MAQQPTSPQLARIRDEIIGEHSVVNTPFGEKPLVYADYTASGRSLGFIERFVQQQVLPYYANTHTETSYTGRHTTELREQARQTIRQALNASERHRLIFCGSGATAAIDKLITMLELKQHGHAVNTHQAGDERPVVFIGPYEHHSNELPWRESAAEVVCIPLDECGQIDLEVLEGKLQTYQHRNLKIGSFSAASNVTGLRSPVGKISALLKQYGFWSCWDYAAAAPYVGIDMQALQLDAVFISTHKFIGGPGTPGILMVNQAMLDNDIPAVPGGGTVSFVTPTEHTYLSDVERREEGGTPGIVESIRAGLVFALQQAVGTDTIEKLERAHTREAIERLQKHPNIEIMGDTEAERLSIISFRIKHGQKHLHYSFVVALLNDLFGIQARGGCSCAGPYGHYLLGLSQDQSRAIEDEMNRGAMLLRPGWIRFNLNYFLEHSTVDYILSAIELLAEHGAAFLPYYQYQEKPGVWCFQGERFGDSANLSSAIGNWLARKDSFEHGVASETDPQALYQQCLREAEEKLRSPNPAWQRFDLELQAQAENLRWFLLPQEVA
ncbi:aminotransferase class V-fold PLP-dependent enzyme [Pseudoteredinibacter isoporae]|uniref:Selenocysteine lyase/cysteine desulfurase n=1 Tax=Pseudoteredinibacter isoporae TaxID=570281 RepID=A0A7X0JXJ4_9GAMM|nr:aminotransferase class V-fold PLP-dependent enzyme [Pseudoteredinibacter isoporae]MBB6523116.1 selenocysteine lyase/cysteine desulfurase [Pseudoteredinibacter isoporae]NHO88636.1 aminotransferase class V-fold PLP-dependent enzyme [Pseudoteredinibacter isoporae]NIB22673.1 aminotransferase class V-fold PLP-dependent enzyme [Pseudoteredinibacter isoporae]